MAEHQPPSLGPCSAFHHRIAWLPWGQRNQISGLITWSESPVLSSVSEKTIYTQHTSPNLFTRVQVAHFISPDALIKKGVTLNLPPEPLPAHQTGLNYSAGSLVSFISLLIAAVDSSLGPLCPMNASTRTVLYYQRMCVGQFCVRTCVCVCWEELERLNSKYNRLNTPKMVTT